MPKIQSHNPDTSVQPAPAFASAAEVTLAEHLRHQLRSDRPQNPYLGRHDRTTATIWPDRLRFGMAQFR